MFIFIETLIWEKATQIFLSFQGFFPHCFIHKCFYSFNKV